MATYLSWDGQKRFTFVPSTSCRVLISNISTMKAIFCDITQALITFTAYFDEVFDELDRRSDPKQAQFMQAHHNPPAPSYASNAFSSPPTAPNAAEEKMIHSAENRLESLEENFKKNSEQEGYPNDYNPQGFGEQAQQQENQNDVVDDNMGNNRASESEEDIKARLEKKQLMAEGMTEDEAEAKIHLEKLKEQERLEQEKMTEADSDLRKEDAQQQAVAVMNNQGEVVHEAAVRQHGATDRLEGLQKQSQGMTGQEMNAEKHLKKIGEGEEQKSVPSQSMSAQEVAPHVVAATSHSRKKASSQQGAALEAPTTQ
eukprot:758988-Hanusia_phi.AAC.3